MSSYLDIFEKKLTVFDIKTFRDAEEMQRRLTNLLFKENYITDESKFIEALIEREEMGSTYMGNGIAIPHGKSDVVSKTSALLCILEEPFEYESNGDSGLVDIILMLALKDGDTSDDEEHLRILSTVARMMTYESFLNGIRDSKDFNDVQNEVIKVVNKIEEDD